MELKTNIEIALMLANTSFATNLPVQRHVRFLVYVGLFVPNFCMAFVCF